MAKLKYPNKTRAAVERRKMIMRTVLKQMGDGQTRYLRDIQNFHHKEHGFTLRETQIALRELVTLKNLERPERRKPYYRLTGFPLQNFWRRANGKRATRV